MRLEIAGLWVMRLCLIREWVKNRGGDSTLLYKFKNRLKHVGYFLIFYSGFLYILVSLLKKIKKGYPAIILFYHRFCQKEKQGGILPSLEIEEFRKQMVHLRKFYTFIDMDEMAQALRDEGKFKQPSVVLTLDDGYLDNYALAYPILYQYHIPATIYLTVGLIGTNLGLWVDELEYGLMHTAVKGFCFRDLFGGEVIRIGTLEEKENAAEMLYQAMVRKNHEEREGLIKRLFEILNVDELEIGKGKRVMLDWREVKEMSENGISFGAHTVSHPFLPAMPLESAKEEIRQSKEIMGKRINKAVKHFAIPNGKREDFTEVLAEFCEEIGFETIVTAEPGVVDANANRFSLRRVLPLPPLYHFACEVARYFFSRN